MQVTKSCVQVNYATPAVVFPLLCPVREKDWLEGWDYEMIYSESGKIEQDCVFITGHHGPVETVWITTEYKPESYLVGFTRVTLGVMAVRISIQLHAGAENKTEAHISYTYTGLSPEGNSYLMHDLDEAFEEDMKTWEQAINHYLITGEMLTRHQAEQF